MSFETTNPRSPAEMVLKHKSLKGVSSSINCYALNYLTHKMLLCSKESVYIYNLAENQVTHRKNYLQELGRLLETEIEIKSADAILFSNLWIALVNKKSFIFFNDQLEFSKLYTISPNFLLSLQVLQRTNEFLTIREDRKSIRIWGFEIAEKLVEDKKEFNLDTEISQASENKKDEMNSYRTRTMTNSDKESFDEKERRLKELGQVFNMSVFARKQIHLPQNRFLIKLAISEELKIAAIALDNAEVLLYNLTSGDLLQSLTFSPSLDKDSSPLTAHVSIDQELLYYCDDQRLAVYDLVLNEEITNHPHGIPAKFLYLQAERSNNSAGVYLLTTDEHLHVYSINLKRSILVLNLRNLNSPGSGIVPFETFRRGFKSSSTGIWNVADFGDGPKKELALKDKISKMRCQITTDMSSFGFVTLLICVSGDVHAFDVMNSAKTSCYSKVNIKEMSILSADDLDSPIMRRVKEGELRVRLQLNDYTIAEPMIRSNEEGEAKPMTDLLAMWKQYSQSDSYNMTESMLKREEENLQASQILYSFVKFEEKLFVAFTQTSMFVMSWGCGRIVSQNLITTQIDTCAVIPLNSEKYGSYYIAVGTNKGAIIIVDCDFSQKALNVVKQMPKHEGVLALRYLKEYHSLLSVGVEGNIYLYSLENSLESPIFSTHQAHKLIWKHVSAIGFLSDTEIIAGLDNGVIQYGHFSWKTDTGLSTKLFEYHSDPIKQIATLKGQDRMFAACCEGSLVSVWHLNEKSPLKIFRLGVPIVSLCLNQPKSQDSVDVYVATKNNILKLDYEQGGCVSFLGRDDDLDWEEALAVRGKYHVKTIREGTTIVPAVNRMTTLFADYKRMNKKILPDGPLMTQFLYSNPRYFTSRAIEADYLQYFEINHHKKSSQALWIMDSILLDFYQKKIRDEPLVPKKDPKASQKNKEKGKWANLLGKTLKKYPMIKSILAEKEKRKELEEVYKNMMFLVNMGYQGEDNVPAMYQFLEQKHGIKPSDIDDGYFMRAKSLYYQKPRNTATANVPNTRKFNATASESSFPFAKNEANSTTGFKTKVQLPALNIDRKYKPSKEVTTAATQKAKNSKLQSPTTGVPKTQHSKKGSGSIETRPSSKFVSPYSTTSNFNPPAKPPTKAIQTAKPKGFSTKAGNLNRNASQNLKLSLNFSFVPSPGVSTLATDRIASEDKLGIGSMENTLRSPFFLTNRGELNRETFVTEPTTRRQPVSGGLRTSTYFNSSVSTEMFKRTAKDFVAMHSKGFQSKENVDLFNHVLRLLLKNHHILKVRSGHNNRLIADDDDDSDKVTESSDEESEVDESEIEYVPIEIKQFVLDTSQKELEMLDQIIAMYERKTGNQLPEAQKKEEYSSVKLEEEMTKENEFLEEILRQVNENGVESVSLPQMIKFKQIMKRRLEVFSRLQAHIEMSGLLRTKPTNAKEIKLKEELRKTFLQVKQITSLKPIFAFKEPLFKSGDKYSFPGLNPMFSRKDGMFSNPWTPVSAVPKEVDFVVGSIKKSLETARTMEKSSRGKMKELDTDTAVKETESSASEEEQQQDSSPKRIVRSLTSLDRPDNASATVRTWEKDDEFSVEAAESPEGKKQSLAQVVNEVKKKRRLSNPFENKNEARLRRRESKMGSMLGEGERQRRLERLLSKQPEMVQAEIERQDTEVIRQKEKKMSKMDMQREIERAWKEKDFGFLRSYLMGDLGDKKKGEKGEDGGKKGKDDAKKNLNKKKKKYRNPNVASGSGSLITANLGNKMKRDSKNVDGEYDDSIREDEGDSLDEEENIDIYSHPLFNKPKPAEPVSLKKFNTFHIDINNTVRNSKRNQTLMKTKSSDSLSQELLSSVERRSKLLEEASQSKKSVERDPIKIIEKEEPRPKTKESTKEIKRVSIEQHLPVRKTTPKSETKLEKSNETTTNNKTISIDLKIETPVLEPVVVSEKQEKYGLENIVLEPEKEEKAPLNSLLEPSTKVKSLDGWDKKKDDSSTSNIQFDTRVDDIKMDVKINESAVEEKKEEKKVERSPTILASRKTMIQDVVNSKKDDEVQEESKDGSKNYLKRGSKKISFLAKGDGTKEQEDQSPPLARTKTEGQLTKLLKNQAKASKFTREKEKKETLIDVETTIIKEEKKEETPKESTKKEKRKQKVLNSPKNEEPKKVEEKDATKLVKFTPYSPTSPSNNKMETSPKISTQKTITKKDLSIMKSLDVSDLPSGETSKVETQQPDEIVIEEPKKEKPAPLPKFIVEKDEPAPPPRRKIVRHNVPKEPKQEDILDDPLKLFQAVLNVKEVDQETKLDLFIYGNRKEALKDFIKEVEDTIEHHILKQGDCSDQLSGFFDQRLTSLLVIKPTLHTHTKQATSSSNIDFMWRKNPRTQTHFEREDPIFPMLRRSIVDFTAEQARRHAFQQHQLLINNLRTRDKNKCSNFSQDFIGAKGDIRKGTILLSVDVVETLLHTNKLETLLEANKSEDKDEDQSDVLTEDEREERELHGKLQRIREVLAELKKRDPPRFKDLITMFYENKRLYQLVLDELDYQRQGWFAPVN